MKEVNTMKRFTLAALMLALALVMSACLTATALRDSSADESRGGVEIMRGLYVWKSDGVGFTDSPGFPGDAVKGAMPPDFPLPAQTNFYETGIIIADGKGHWKQCQTSAYGFTVTNVTDNGLPIGFGGTLDTGPNGKPVCTFWTYTLTNHMGTAKSNLGDWASLFCSETGKLCYMIQRTPNAGPWVQRIERE